jgi:hypothetical protein
MGPSLAKYVNKHYKLLAPGKSLLVSLDSENRARCNMSVALNWTVR